MSSNTKGGVITVPSTPQNPSNAAIGIKEKLIILGGQSLGIIGLLVLAWVSKNILQPKLSAAKRVLALPVETERHINGLLGRILATSAASRVLVAQFHNGQSYYSGYSYSKLTITHEVVDAGVASIAFNMKEIPLSLYAEDLALVKQSTNKYVFITSDSFVSNRTSSVSRQRMLRMGVEGYYCFLLQGIVDKEDREIGAVFLQYGDLDRVRNISNEIEELIATVESYLVPHDESSNFFVWGFNMLSSLINKAKD